MHKNVKDSLEKAGVEYKIHKHAELPIPIKSPNDFARAIGYGLDRITKSLFVRSQNKDKYAVVVCPMNKNINFTIIATELACTRVEVASKDELQSMICYPPNGVSPIGIGNFPVFIDESLMKFETIVMGAGETGVEVEIAPQDVIKMTSGRVCGFSIDR